MVLSALLFAIFIGIFLFVLQPFGLHQLGDRLLGVCGGFALITGAIMLFMNGFMVWTFPRFFREEHWTVGKEITWSLLHILLIGLFNAYYIAKIGFATFSARQVLNFETYTFIVGFFPVTISVLVKEVRLSRKFQQESQEISTELGKNSTPDAHSVLTFPSETKNDDFTTDISKLRYLEAAENYVVFWSGDPAHPKTIVRITMKQCEELLKPYPAFLRVHKSYLVNLHQIERLSGNAQGYKIHLSGVSAAVPVSRKMNIALRSALSFRP